MKTNLKKAEFVTVLVVSNSMGRELNCVTEPDYSDEDHGEYYDNIISYFSVRSDVWSDVQNEVFSEDKPEIQKASKLIRRAHSTHALSYLTECGLAFELN